MSRVFFILLALSGVGAGVLWWLIQAMPSGAPGDSAKSKASAESRSQAAQQSEQHANIGHGKTEKAHEPEQVVATVDGVKGIDSSGTVHPALTSISMLPAMLR